MRGVVALRRRRGICLPLGFYEMAKANYFAQTAFCEVRGGGRVMTSWLWWKGLYHSLKTTSVWERRRRHALYALGPHSHG